MEEILDSLLGYIVTVDDYYLYLFLFLSAFVENIFPPAPGDTITVFGAFMVGTGRLEYLLVYLATTAGSVLGFMSLYFLGCFVDRRFFHKKRFRIFSDEAIDKTLKAFGRYGYYIVLANRFLPGVRSVISITAGFAELRVHAVFLMATISAMVWNFIWIQAGFMLGDNWNTVRKGIAEILGSYNRAALIIISLVAAYFFLKKILVRK